jgi:NADH-quinone oxidoreductase subunit M
MTLLAFPLLLLLGAMLAWLVGLWSSRGPNVVAVATTTVGLLASVGAWATAPASNGRWFWELQWSWIEEVGVSFHLAADGLTLLMVTLTFGLGLVAALVSMDEFRPRDGPFHACILAVLAGLVGVFLSVDLVVFYLFWELMLVPMYFLIGIWGHEDRVYAAVKFFLFTQVGGLLMLLGIVALGLVHQQQTGELSFAYAELLGTSFPGNMEMWIFLAFFAAFAVKLPVVGLHSWLPDAHTEAPTAVSVILAGLLLKTGAYGLIRFSLPLFPGAAADFAPFGMVLGALGVIYGAWLAFAQDDAKRLVAYTSVSHLGFVLLGIFALNEVALRGAIFEMVCHGLSTGALFVVVGIVQSKFATRDLDQLGGIWRIAPRLGALALLFALASIGLPGLGNFVAEFLVLSGAFQVRPIVTSIATFGLVGATIYALWFIQQLFHGRTTRAVSLRQPVSLRFRETLVLVGFAVCLVLLGLFPQPVLDLIASIGEVTL